MHCKNCDNSLQTHHDFCYSCGAKVIRNRLTMKALFSHFVEQYINYDNKFIKTVFHLITKPEAVIGSYINGTRKKYVNVISFFALIITISGLQLFILNKYYPETLDLSSITVEGQEEMANNNLKFIQDYQSLIMMLYVPIYALLSWIVFFNKKIYNYTEHLVIFMYILAELSLFSAIVSIGGALLGLTLGSLTLIVMPVQIIYSAYCLKRLFQLSVKGILLKTLLFLLILLVFFIMFSIIMAVIMYLNGDIEAMIEVQKAAQ